MLSQVATLRVPFATLEMLVPLKPVGHMAAAAATRSARPVGSRRRAGAAGIGILAIVVTLAVPGTALADSQPGGAANPFQSTVSGDQLQGPNALPGDGQIAVPDTPFVTDGSSAPFDRSAAVAFALAHAQDPEPFPAGGPTSSREPCSPPASRKIHSGT